MTSPLLPRRADNDYRGRKVALWIFGLVVFVKLAIGVNSIFNGYSVASSADGIPLDTYAPAGARTIVSLFALLGLSHLVMALLCMLVLVRYRTLVPLMFTLLLVEHLGRRLIFYFLPIARTGTPPGSAINLVLLALMVAGLALSLWSRGDATRAAEGRSR
jgi:hypothetical protein